MHRSSLIAMSILLAAAPLGGCKQAAPAKAETVVDSVVPHDVAIGRFRSGIPRVDSLSGGASSRDQLVRDFVHALEARDTAALRGLTMTKAEYAWLYYPTTPQGLPPYDLSPSLLWFMLEGKSNQGFGHLVEQRFGQPLHVARYECDARPSVEGGNKVWGPCMLLRVQGPRDTLRERLFGSILERHGRFKFINLSNRLS